MPLIRINHRPSPRQLLVFSIGWLAFAGSLGALQWVRDRHAAAEICWGLAWVAPVAWLVWREGLRRLFLGLCYATYPLSYVVSTAVLTILFFGVLTPIGIALRLARHDPLARRRISGDTSYWRPREGARSPEGYFRQY